MVTLHLQAERAQHGYCIKRKIMENITDKSIRIQEIETKIREIKEQKERALKSMKYESAARLKDEEENLLTELQKIKI